uniref:Uncharacterized protein n=1 Tax=Ditylenchus dipsaci TaxID=166011 RepID=A0A915CYB1_9BILA
MILLRHLFSVIGSLEMNMQSYRLNFLCKLIRHCAAFTKKGKQYRLTKSKQFSAVDVGPCCLFQSDRGIKINVQLGEDSEQAFCVFFKQHKETIDAGLLNCLEYCSTVTIKCRTPTGTSEKLKLIKSYEYYENLQVVHVEFCEEVLCKMMQEQIIRHSSDLCRYCGDWKHETRECVLHCKRYSRKRVFEAIPDAYLPSYLYGDKDAVPGQLILNKDYRDTE